MLCDVVLRLHARAGDKVSGGVWDVVHYHYYYYFLILYRYLRPVATKVDENSHKNGEYIVAAGYVSYQFVVIELYVFWPCWLHTWLVLYSMCVTRNGCTIQK